MTDKDVLPENDMLEKATALKRFDYSPLGESFEKQTNFIKKQTKVINKNNYKINNLLKK